MPSFKKLLILCAMVAAGYALTVRDVDHSRCSGAKLIDSTTIHAGGHDIIKTTHSCTSSSIERRQTYPVDVCGETCTTICNDDAGVLPPISEDCDTIKNAIVVLQGSISPTFIVPPGHVETLTFGTCSYFFENLSINEIEFCWSDLSTLGSAAGAACFPPVQPFFSQGLCTSSDGAWEVGATHS